MNINLAWFWKEYKIGKTLQAKPPIFDLFGDQKQKPPHRLTKMALRVCVTCGSNPCTHKFSFLSYAMVGQMSIAFFAEAFERQCLGSGAPVYEYIIEETRNYKHVYVKFSQPTPNAGDLFFIATPLISHNSCSEQENCAVAEKTILEVMKTAQQNDKPLVIKKVDLENHTVIKLLSNEEQPFVLLPKDGVNKQDEGSDNEEA
jgi:hypothetical protein